MRLLSPATLWIGSYHHYPEERPARRVSVDAFRIDTTPVTNRQFAAFVAAAFSAQRNIILVGLIAPIVIVSYLPWKRPVPPFAPFAASLLLIGAGMATSWGSAFQLRAAEWRYPAGAASFLR